MKFLAPIFLILSLLTVACSDFKVEKATITPHSVNEFGLDSDSSAGYDKPLEELPEPTIAMRFKPMGSYAKVFNDSNYVHQASAESIGIQPLTDTKSYWNTNTPLEKIVSCADFYVEPLKYSRPYLVPKAAAMLHEIGRRFNDSINARGGGNYRIKVTSALRTPSSIERLQRHNVNAIDSSVHQYGTTVDISYARFACFSPDIPRSMSDLKGVLAEVLLAMRNEGKCWVKYEIHQPCFHITVRDLSHEQSAK